MRRILTLCLTLVVCASSAFGQTAQIQTVKTGHFHLAPNKKLSGWQSKALARVYRLSDKTKEQFRGNPASVLGNSPGAAEIISTQDVHNSHCEQLKKKNSKPCSQNPNKGQQSCQCTASWEKSDQKDPNGVPYCVEVEHDNCVNACCFNLCGCIHMPPEGCTLASCRELRSLIRALVAQGVLILTSPAHSHAGP